MNNKNKESDEKDVCQIHDFSEFALFVQHNAVQMAFSKLSLNPLVLDHIVDVMDGSITEPKLYYHFNNFMFSKDSKKVNYTSDDLYVFKNDIGRMITLIANDIVSFSLCKMVDKELMTLCWDKKAKDFIFLEKIKK